jgi:hypothetical protein
MPRCCREGLGRERIFEDLKMKVQGQQAKVATFLLLALTIILYFCEALDSCD